MYNLNVENKDFIIYGSKHLFTEFKLVMVLLYLSSVKT